MGSIIAWHTKQEGIILKRGSIKWLPKKSLYHMGGDCKHDKKNKESRASYIMNKGTQQWKI